MCANIMWQLVLAVEVMLASAARPQHWDAGLITAYYCCTKNAHKYEFRRFRASDHVDSRRSETTEDPSTDDDPQKVQEVDVMDLMHASGSTRWQDITNRFGFEKQKRWRIREFGGSSDTSASAIMRKLCNDQLGTGATLTFNKCQ